MTINTLNGLTSSGYLRIPQILQLIPIGRSTWWQWVSNGKAPKPVKLGPRITAWRAEDIAEFIDSLNRNSESDTND